jgi:hypothetical protein
MEKNVHLRSYIINSDPAPPPQIKHEIPFLFSKELHIFAKPEIDESSRHPKTKFYGLF